MEEERPRRFAPMVTVSALVHVALIGLILVIAARGGSRATPMVAYTVEITDPSAVGGRLPAGAPTEPISPEPGRPEPAPARSTPPEPPREVKAPPEPAPPPKAKPEPKPVTPPKAVAKPEPKPEPKKPKVEEPAPKEATKPAKVTKAAPPKAETAKPAEKATKKVAEAPPRPAPRAEKPAAPERAAAAEAAKPPASEQPRDAYTAAADRWRTRGGGLGGPDGGSGPIGTGDGPGGGGQLVGLEFLAYRQTVISTVRANWTSAVSARDLVAVVRFEIGRDGSVSHARLEEKSGNAAYDASVLQAVRRTRRLPPPPARYFEQFREFQIRFHPEERGGRAAG